MYDRVLSKCMKHILFMVCHQFYLHETVGCLLSLQSSSGSYRWPDIFINFAARNCLELVFDHIFWHILPKSKGIKYFSEYHSENRNIWSLYRSLTCLIIIGLETLQLPKAKIHNLVSSYIGHKLFSEQLFVTYYKILPDETAERSKQPPTLCLTHTPLSSLDKS